MADFDSYAPPSRAQPPMDFVNHHYTELAALIRQRRNVLRALIALTVVITLSTLGFAWLEPHWTVWDAFFFTLVTITTVGYGDYGLDARGQVFATLLLIAGIGITTYALGQVVQMAVNNQAARRRKMLKQIAHLKDHFIVCGAGRVGQAVCERFTESGVALVVIDLDPERCEWARAQGHFALEGVGTDDQTLINAGVTRCRGLVASTDNESENLVTTLTAREHNPDCLIICRSDDPESEAKFRRAGANRVVAPETNGGHIIANLLVRPNTTDFLAHTGNYDIQLSELLIRPNSKLIGRTLETLKETDPDIVLVALKAAGCETRLNPNPDHLLTQGDVLIIVAQLTQLAQISEHAAA